EVMSVLEQLSGERARILRPAGEEGYEIRHDALAAPILDWRARWQEREKRARERKKVVRLVALALALAVIAIALVALAVFALTQERRARSAANLARQQEILVRQGFSRDYVRAALAQLTRNPDRSLRLALAAYNADPTPAAEFVLRQAVAQ